MNGWYGTKIVIFGTMASANEVMRILRTWPRRGLGGLCLRACGFLWSFSVDFEQLGKFLHLLWRFWNFVFDLSSFVRSLQRYKSPSSSLERQPWCFVPFKKDKLRITNRYLNWHSHKARSFNLWQVSECRLNWLREINLIILFSKPLPSSGLKEAE